MSDIEQRSDMMFWLFFIGVIAFLLVFYIVDSIPSFKKFMDDHNPWDRFIYTACWIVVFAVLGSLFYLADLAAEYFKKSRLHR